MRFDIVLVFVQKSNKHQIMFISYYSKYRTLPFLQTSSLLEILSYTLSQLKKKTVLTLFLTFSLSSSNYKKIRERTESYPESYLNLTFAFFSVSESWVS